MRQNHLIIAALALILCLVVALLVLYLQSREPRSESVVPITNSGEIVECYTDTDCIVGGCSGTVCAARSEADNLVTTCEYRNEYACFAKDNCLCIQNRCNWQGSQQFRNCVLAPETQDPCAGYEGQQLLDCQADEATQSRCRGLAGMELLDCLVGNPVNPDD
ncbi:MAG: eight-cysteine-cluster domain-containing protein [Candidatus Kerfeldbacteria bacterium]|nr:eight-cysteine-cluster domain-containing protein [Candidatus Kerfeldbacteria bacterium]